MTDLAASVGVRLKSVDIVSDALRDKVKKAQAPYVRAQIGPFIIGRSNIIEPGQTFLTLPLDDARWAARVRVPHGGAVSVVVEVWDAANSAGPLERLPGTIGAPWPEGLITFKSDHMRVTANLFDVRVVPPAKPTAVAPRATQDFPDQAVIRVANKIVVDITDIKGLYEPVVGLGASRPANKQGAQQKPGYKSLDHRGRIFLNRKRDGAWKANEQSIEIAATAETVEGFLPPDAEIEWTVHALDDPTDDDPDMHLEWGAYLDPDDYEDVTPPAPPDAPPARLRRHHGPEITALDRHPRWDRVGAFELTIDSEPLARTKIVKGKSSVIIHCPNMAGDQLVVSADIFSASTKVTGYPDHTGSMTMWNRVDVEYRRLEGAEDVPIAEVPGRFEPLCTQLDFVTTPVVPSAKAALFDSDKKATNSNLWSFAQPLFIHKNQPGWFLLIAAQEAYPENKPGPSLFNGPVTVMAGTATVGDDKGGTAATTFDGTDVFFIPKLSNTPERCVAIFTWTDSRLAPPASVSILCGAALNDAGTITRVRIRPNEHQIIFNAKTSTGDEESVKEGHRFLALPTRQAIDKGDLNPVWRAPGYGVPAGVAVELHSGGDELNGVTLRRPDNEEVAPIAFVFTKATGSPAKSLRVAVHELTHVLDLPHKCGFWDFHTQRQATCCMTYTPQWALTGTPREHVDDNLAGNFLLTPGTAGLTGADHCGKHIKEARRIHLEDHPGLKWK